MLTQQRHQLILARLKQDGEIVATTLSEELGLSEDTVRRDLRALASQGLLQRVHGGALPASPAVANFKSRTQMESTGKQAIARAAAGMVQPGQVVFLDGGTTCQQLARCLPASLSATIATHSPTIALELIEHPLIEVILIGGRLFKHSIVAVGAAAVEAIGRIHADIYFMGVTGVSTTRGLTTGDLEEAHVKRALMSQSAETWVLASAEKLNAVSTYVVAPCREASGVIVERGTGTQDTAGFIALGLDVMHA